MAKIHVKIPKYREFYEKMAKIHGKKHPAPLIYPRKLNILSTSFLSSIIFIDLISFFESQKKSTFSREERTGILFSLSPFHPSSGKFKYSVLVFEHQYFILAFQYYFYRIIWIFFHLLNRENS